VCDAGDFELAKILLAHMELDRGLIRNLPLNSAIRTKNLDLIGAVLDAGADINIRAHKRDKVKEQKESERRSSLEVAMGFGPEVVDYLIQRGAVIPPLSAWVKGDRQVYNILRDGVFDYQDKNKRLPTYPEFRDMTTKERRKY
jgi:ankyrin repeat protein